MLVLFVLKNDVECTSQRFKWTSGARVMVLFNPDVLETNEGQFCLRCPAGGPALEKS